MRTNLASFTDEQKLHTGFYSIQAYSIFKGICKKLNDTLYKSFFTFRSCSSEVIVCTNLPSSSELIWNNFGLTSWHKGISLHECLRLVIAKYAQVDSYNNYVEIKAWAEGKDPVDTEQFKKLVGTPIDPIKAEMKAILAEEEQKINEKFDRFRDEVSNRRFESTNTLFTCQPCIANGNKGYVQSIASEECLAGKAKELYDAEKNAYDALRLLIKAADDYGFAQQQWHEKNKEIKHLLILAKNKELDELRKSMKIANA